MTSTENLILDLSVDLAPVRQRNLWAEVSALLGIGATEAALIASTGAMRPDLGQVILSPFMAWKMGGLAALAAVCCTVAVRSFSPPDFSRRSLDIVLALAALVASAGVSVTTAAERSRPLLDRLMPVHGMCCAAAIVVLALPIVGLLAWLMRRAAPVHPERSAWAAGVAAASCGALVFTLCCPANDPLYVVVWYAIGVSAVAAAARWLLPRRFRL